MRDALHFQCTETDDMFPCASRNYNCCDLVILVRRSAPCCAFTSMCGTDVSDIFQRFCSASFYRRAENKTVSPRVRSLIDPRHFRLSNIRQGGFAGDRLAPNFCSCDIFLLSKIETFFTREISSAMCTSKMVYKCLHKTYD